MNTYLTFHRSGTGPADRRAGRVPSLLFCAIDPPRQPAIPDEGRSEKIMMRYFLVPVFLAILLSGCNKFDQSHFIKEEFGTNLTPLLKDKRVEYSDGLLQIFEVTESDLLYQTFFNTDYQCEKVGLGFDKLYFRTSQLGEIRYRIIGSFDEYKKTIFYIPKKHILGFGYATDFGG